MKRWIDKKIEVRKLKKWEAAWLAGVIDSEGSVGLYDYGREGRRVFIQIANVNYQFLKFAQDLIGCGSLSDRKHNSPSHRGKKIVNIYGLKGSNRSYHLLKQLIPFLIIKKQKSLDIIKELEEKPFGRWANATKEYREKAAEVARKRWANPEYHARTVEAMRKFYRNQKNLVKHGKRMKEVWQKRKSLSVQV